MTQLIRKGGFRERANRSARFASSENQLTTLPTHHYPTAQQDVTEATRETKTETTMTMTLTIDAENQLQECHNTNTKQK